MWTPALSGGGGHGDAHSDDPPPYGQMFATFMLCCMCGSTVYSILSKCVGRGGRAEQMGRAGGVGVGWRASRWAGEERGIQKGYRRVGIRGG
jgi:hypothetical protein